MKCTLICNVPHTDERSLGIKRETLLPEKRFLGHLWSSEAHSFSVLHLFANKGPAAAADQPQVLQRESCQSVFAKIGELTLGSRPTFVTGTFGCHFFRVYRKPTRRNHFSDLCIS